MKSIYNFITESIKNNSLFDDLLASLQEIENEKTIYTHITHTYDDNPHIYYFLGSIEQLCQRYTGGTVVSHPGDRHNPMAWIYLDIKYIKDAPTPNNIQIGFLLDGYYDFNYDVRPSLVLITSKQYPKLYNKYFKSLNCIDKRRNIYELDENTINCLITFCQDLKDNKQEIIQAMKEADPNIAGKWIKQSELKPIVQNIESILT